MEVIRFLSFSLTTWGRLRQLPISKSFLEKTSEKLFNKARYFGMYSLGRWSSLILSVCWMSRSGGCLGWSIRHWESGTASKSGWLVIEPSGVCMGFYWNGEMTKVCEDRSTLPICRVGNTFHQADGWRKRMSSFHQAAGKRVGDREFNEGFRMSRQQDTFGATQ